MNEAVTDDEAVDVFVEEANEVFENVDNSLAVWREKPSDSNALTEIRRSFHTLKGSGRMVNALDLAEVAWKVENMLNRVIDGSIQATRPVVDLVTESRGILPRMLDAFKNRRPFAMENEVETLMEKADALAGGGTPTPARAPAPTTPSPRPRPTTAAPAGGEPRLALKMVELDRRLARSQLRADEALHRSEMALQYARRIGAHIQAMEGEARDHVGRAEANRIIDRVNLLAREIRELRQETGRAQTQQPPHSREINQIVERRLRERVAPIERQRNELMQQLTEARNAASTSRGIAWFALILSVLVGGGAIALFMMSGPTLG